MEAAALKIRNDSRKSIGRAANPDMHQDNGAVELVVGLARNSLD